MCGIAGYLGQGDQEILRRMTDAIAYRGPDDSGFFVAPGVGLGMRRLSIIDLSGGHQPMCNEDKTVVVTLNGEIYNYRELRTDLQRAGHEFTSQSDTEVIVHGYEQYGQDVVARLNGMFAVALWDGQKRQLVLARDRLGKKPLYWGVWQGTLLYGSEPKALLQHSHVSRAIDWVSLAQYLIHEYVPTPRAIFAGMRKLPGGSVLTYQAGGQPAVTRFWEVPLKIQPMAAAEALPRLDTLLQDAVRRRLVSDVPLGVFLSGGIDSSTVAYYAQSSSSQPVKTFSIGFTEATFDESSHARRVARHLGTEHYEQVLRPSAALALIPKLADLMDEPFADPSLVPTYLLSQFARRQVTVAVGGDGGDELLFGYPTFQAERFAHALPPLPAALLRRMNHWVARWKPRSYDYLTWHDKLQRFLRGLEYPHDQWHLAWIGAFAPDQLFRLLTPEALEQCRGDVLADPTGQISGQAAIDHWTRVAYWYLKGYLQDDILAKVDRASMFASLEVRAPFLDYRLVEFFFSLPVSLRLRGFRTKYLLKRLMADRLPAGILGRRKQGFAVPVGRWLRNELKPLAEDLLSPDALTRQGIFQPAAVRQLLADHANGRVDNRKELWTLLCFQLWWRRWGSAR